MVLIAPPGAEYFVLIADEQHVATLIEKLQQALTLQCHFQNIQLHLQYSFGIVRSAHTLTVQLLNYYKNLMWQFNVQKMINTLSKYTILF